MFRLVQKNDGVRKVAAEMPLRGRIEFAEAFRVGANFTNEPLDFFIKPAAECEGDVGKV
ncbi:MAG TPA: hypothetical protein VFY06_01460 [Verrucomicrobiae bacterium]|nr:hypothetical protein [Verrucomicrobiae bacterium]